MKNINLYEEFKALSNDVDVQDEYLKLKDQGKSEDEARELIKLDLSTDNVKKMVDFQKKHGGVISVPSGVMVDHFKDFGYEIIKMKNSEVIADENILNDIKNHNKVNYIIEFIPEEKPNIL